MKNKGYAKCWAANKVHYGRCASGEYCSKHSLQVNGNQTGFAADATLQQAHSFILNPFTFLTPFDHCFVFHLVSYYAKTLAL